MKPSVMPANPVDEEPQTSSARNSGGLSGFVDAWFDRRPDALAWCDQAGREAWSGRPARSLTWRAARDASLDLAARFSRLGLTPGAFVGLCLPNGSEWLAAVLGLERAGLTPCLLPVDAGRDELLAAVESIGIEAIVTQAILGPLRPARLACEVAARYFRMRHVLAFGPEIPDGVADLDASAERSRSEGGDPRASRGIVTFDRSGARWRPVLRPYASLAAAAGSLAAALRPGHDDVFVTLLAPDDVKALVSGCILPLVTGCRIEAHGIVLRRRSRTRGRRRSRRGAAGRAGVDGGRPSRPPPTDGDCS